MARAEYCWPLIAVVVLCANLTLAQSFTWDASGANPTNPTNGSGNWDTTSSANWSNGTTDGTWVSGSTAVFEPKAGAPNAVVTIDDPSGAVNVGLLELAGNYSIAATPGDTLTMVPQAGGAVPGIVGAAVISAPIAGTDGVDVSGGLLLTGQNTYTGATLSRQGEITLANGASLGNTSISGSQGGLDVRGSAAAGTGGAGNSGATMTVLGTGLLFSMEDGTIGTFTLQQQSGFTGTALTGIGGGFGFDLGETAADKLIDSGPGTASVRGTNVIDISTNSDAYLTPGSYTLISVPAGGLTGTFDFFNGTTTETVTVGGTAYTLTLTNSDTAEILTVLPEPASAALMALAGIFLLRRRQRRTPCV